MKPIFTVGSDTSCLTQISALRLGSFTPCLKNVKTPQRRIFFRYSTVVFLWINRVWLRQIALIGDCACRHVQRATVAERLLLASRKNHSPSDIPPFIKQDLAGQRISLSPTAARFAGLTAERDGRCGGRFCPLITQRTAQRANVMKLDPSRGTKKYPPARTNVIKLSGKAFGAAIFCNFSLQKKRFLRHFD